MKLRLLSVFAAVALVAACESDPATTGGANTGGNTGANPSGTGMSQTMSPQDMFNQAVSGQDRVFFDFDRYNVRADARPVLERWAAWMRANPNHPVVVEGHADERGTREYNLALGERRANSVRDFLVSQGVSAGQVTVISFGKERPAMGGSDEGSWAQNRRSVAVVGGGPVS